jgi:FHA domain-containing protein
MPGAEARASSGNDFGSLIAPDGTATINAHPDAPPIPMTLILRAVSLNDQPITQPITASFGPKGGSIGRADTNTLPLPDPERRISRRQAEIVATGHGFVIKNVGTANPIIVRNQSLALGESAPLRHDDQVRIGGYLLEVAQSSDDGDDRTSFDAPRLPADPFGQIAVAAPSPGPAAASSRSAPAFPPSSPFADLGGPLSTGNPFAELLGDPARGQLRTPSGPRAASPTPARLPDDFDPFAPSATPAAPPARAPTSGTAGAFDDLIPSVAPGSIDSLFGLERTGAQDPLAAFLAGAPAARSPSGGSGNPALSTDPLDLFGGAGSSKAPMPSAPTLPDETPELRAAFTPPRPQLAPMPVEKLTPRKPMPASAPAEPAANRARMPPAAAVASPPPPADESTVPPATGWTPDALSVWHALCEGAGVRLDPPPNTGPAFMRVVGMMLRSSVEGTVQLMAMRQATRQELQAQVTVIRPKNNNPLKFAPDGQSAMEQVLQPAVRGFLPGPAAMTDAMHDLLGHAIGTMAGTRAALEGVLKRFSPQELEAKLTDNSMLDSVLPMNRKAKLWELYLQHYESIRDEAQEDFHTLFGRAFLAAYEQQLERLRREKPAAPK